MPRAARAASPSTLLHYRRVRTNNEAARASLGLGALQCPFIARVSLSNRTALPLLKHTPPPPPPPSTCPRFSRRSPFAFSRPRVGKAHGHPGRQGDLLQLRGARGAGCVGPRGRDSRKCQQIICKCVGGRALLRRRRGGLFSYAAVGSARIQQCGWRAGRSGRPAQPITGGPLSPLTKHSAVRWTGAMRRGAERCGSMR